MRAGARSRVCIDPDGELAQSRSDLDVVGVSVFERTQRFRQPGQFCPSMLANYVEERQRRQYAPGAHDGYEACGARQHFRR